MIYMNYMTRTFHFQKERLSNFLKQCTTVVFGKVSQIRGSSALAEEYFPPQMNTHVVLEWVYDSKKLVKINYSGQINKKKNLEHLWL